MKLLTFFSLTYVASWSLWFAAARLTGPGAGFVSLAAGLLLLAGTVAPAVVALALVAHSEGREGVGAILARIARAPTDLRWYVLAVTYMLVIKIAVAASHRALAAVWPPFGNTPWYLLIIATAVSTPVQAGEEIGWRGFALPRLSAALGLPVASIFLGVIWACWHLPLFFPPIGDNVGQSFPVYVVAVTGISVAMAWLYWRTKGSLLLTMLMHAATNNVAGIVHSQPAVGANPFTVRPTLVSWLTAAFVWVPAAYFLMTMRNSRRLEDVFC